MQGGLGGGGGGGGGGRVIGEKRAGGGGAGEGDFVLLTDLHGFQLAQQGAGGFWDVGGQVLMARLGSLAPLL